MGKKILITGITGNVGNEVAKILLEQGHGIKAAVRGRDHEKAKADLGREIEVVQFDFEKAETYSDAFNRVEAVFLMRPPAISNVRKYINPAIDTAIDCGVEHIVFLSLLGVEKNPIVPHYKIEKHILKRNIPYTFLRPSFFMQNLSGFYREEIKKRSEIFVPAGKGKTSFIDCRDIAEIGAMSLIDPSHRNKAYSLTGSEALDYYEVADIFTEVLERKITYANPSPLRYKRRMRELGIDDSFIKVMQAIYFTAKIGLAKRVTDEVQKLLKRPPISMKQFVADYAELWK
ncbi:MAG: SDR family oxidoreductase [Clostridia bacterium]|nr:SDR family oxidoreductase [Clostridia bacterium]